MRKVILTTMVLGIVAAGGCGKKPQAGPSASQLQGSISLSGAWALYPMVVKWSEEFRKLHPQVQIDIAAGGAGKGMADCLSDAVDLGMISREIHPAEIERGAFPLAVTKDAVVPTVNRNHPAIARIVGQGDNPTTVHRHLDYGQDHDLGGTCRRQSSRGGPCLYPLGCLRGGRNLGPVHG